MKKFSKKELKWISDLKEVADRMPSTLCVFVNESAISIFKGKDLPMNRYGGVDNDVEHIDVHPKGGLWEAGAW